LGLALFVKEFVSALKYQCWSSSSSTFSSNIAHLPGHYLLAISSYAERTKFNPVLSDYTKCKYIHSSAFIVVVLGYLIFGAWGGTILQSKTSISKSTGELAGTLSPKAET
jgi:hypothetical protein